MRHREKAICLRTVDYSETSQVVHFLTRGVGLVKMIAKGSKRPKSNTGGALDLLCEGDLVYSSGRGGEALGTLIEFTETVSRTALRRRAGGGLNAALYLMELAEAMVAEGDPHPEVFDLLHNGLARLGDADAPVAAVLAYCQWRMLRHAGLLGEMSACMGCGTPVDRASGGDVRHMVFSSRRGGLLCGSCETAADEKYPTDATTLGGLRAMRAAEAGRGGAMDDAQARSVSRMLAYHITEQLGKRLKMERYAIA